MLLDTKEKMLKDGAGHADPEEKSPTDRSVHNDYARLSELENKKDLRTMNPYPLPSAVPETPKK